MAACQGILAALLEHERTGRGRQIDIAMLDASATLEEIAVEKLVALTDKARNEPRHLYDLWHFMAEGHVDLELHKARALRS